MEKQSTRKPRRPQRGAAKGIFRYSGGSLTSDSPSPAPTGPSEATSFTLSEFLERMGRVIAFYPGLAKIIGIEETIFLQQLLYWTPRAEDKDGWVYKSAAEWEDETSLTYRQQARARRVLKGRGLVRERYSRLQHRLYFKAILEVIDQLLPAGAPDETSYGEMTKRRVAPDETSDGDTTKGMEAPDETSYRLRNIDYAETPTETTQRSQIQNQPPLTPPASQVGRSNCFEFECAAGIVRVYAPFGRRLYRKGEVAHLNACQISLPASYCTICGATPSWHNRKPERRRRDQPNDDGHEFQSDELDRSNNGKWDSGPLMAFFKLKGFRVEFVNPCEQPTNARDVQAASSQMGTAQ